MYKNNNLPQWIYDGNPSTCQPNRLAKNASVSFVKNVPLTWIRLVVKNASK